jgi:hypothetical protein
MSEDGFYWRHLVNAVMKGANVRKQQSGHLLLQVGRQAISVERALLKSRQMRRAGIMHRKQEKCI